MVIQERMASWKAEVGALQNGCKDEPVLEKCEVDELLMLDVDDERMEANEESEAGGGAETDTEGGSMLIKYISTNTCNTIKSTKAKPLIERSEFDRTSWGWESKF